ncbi:GNAT family N-acetyltransferase [Butyrivibrio sp. MC2021]|uniref:GNAT family N-acetyltransferase n=1 Tax=Butyrivibrio sp. MC2021 TaxID=1408306 RepID=UPI00047BF945|nr:GNAT family N-acetyltransferase [Butyrivibrio sp. MC2021]
MVRAMTIDDYDEVYALWMSIHGFGIRTMDDSREGIERFIKRNPTTSAVDIEDGKVVGAILCGNDGRRACLYHVCVSEAYRMHGIGKKMVQFCCERLKEEGINKVCLNAFVTNEVGNRFWQKMGWTLRSDMNYYDFTLNDENLTVFNK